MPMIYKKHITPEGEAATVSAKEATKNRELLASLGADLPSIEVSAAPLATGFEQAKSVSGTKGITSGVEERALSLLGSGIAAEQVAAALGVTPSRIAQLLAVESFSKQVADLRYDNLQKHNVRDEAYNNLEDRLLTKLNSAIPMLIKPRDIIDALSKVNAAKRRGQSAPTQVNNTQNVVNLVLPAIITERFAIDLNNQVTRAGEQELLTMPSGNLLKQVEEKEALRLESTEESPVNGLQEEHR